MNETNKPISKGGTSTLVRARFGPGMLLRHDDLEQLNTYTRELSSLLFRSLFGCGVVCGLIVEPKEDECGNTIVTVSPGLALDCSGYPVQLPAPQSLTIDAHCKDTPLWVVLCGTSKCCVPRTPVCTSDDEESASVCTRERDGFEIRIVSDAKCACGCPDAVYRDLPENKCQCANPALPCYTKHYAGECPCSSGEKAECCCDCILLARLERPYENQPLQASHAVRRFVRPVLMRDPQTHKEEEARKKTAETVKETEEQAALSKAREEAGIRADERARIEGARIKAEQVQKEQAEKEQAPQGLVQQDAEQPAVAAQAERTPSPPKPAKPRARQG